MPTAILVPPMSTAPIMPHSLSAPFARQTSPHRATTEHNSKRCRSALNALGAFIPRHWDLAKVSFIRHVAGQCGVVAEDCVFHNRLAGAHGLEKSPKVGLDVVVIGSLECDCFGHWLAAQFRIILLVP